jgi:hypothetical protein
MVIPAVGFLLAGVLGHPAINMPAATNTAIAAHMRLILSRLLLPFALSPKQTPRACARGLVLY